jgi:hypothetical protein
MIVPNAAAQPLFLMRIVRLPHLPPATLSD